MRGTPEDTPWPERKVPCVRRTTLLFIGGKFYNAYESCQLYIKYPRNIKQTTIGTPECVGCEERLPNLPSFRCPCSDQRQGTRIQTSVSNATTTSHPHRTRHLSTVRTIMKRSIAFAEPENRQGGRDKSYRRQEPVSCEFCRKKKLKCDRGAPCSNCSARKIACSSSAGELKRLE